MTDALTWSAPECPFAVEFTPRMLDSIRMDVSDAFYSLPRGGAEIGGILLGKWEYGKLRLTGFRQLACEHAFGPSFNLSPADRTRLGQLIEDAKAAGEEVGGWYHSHTRSEIFLSEADLQIHADFFPEPWQIAMVLRPHTLRPMRAGIFFRGPEGAIYSQSAFNEITLEPLDKRARGGGGISNAIPGIPGISPASQVIVDAPPAPAEQILPPRNVPAAVAAVAPEPSPADITTETPPPVAAPPATASPPVVAAHPEPELLPGFLSEPEPAPWPRWPKVAAILLAAAAIGAAGYWKRDLWLPRIVSIAPPRQLTAAPATAPQLSPALGLNTVDLDGQLQVRWNRNSPTIAQASSATLQIAGPNPMPAIALDREHLLSGTFTVERHSERVDVTMIVTGPGGGVVREATTYVGALPAHKPADSAVARPAVPAVNAELLQEVRRLRADLDAETAHGKRLQKDVDFLAKEFRDQHARLINQAK